MYVFSRAFLALCWQPSTEILGEDTGPIVTSQKTDIFNFSDHLLVDNQQVGALIRALGVGLVPGGQQVDVTNQPVAAAWEAQPARGADGWRQQRMTRY